MADSKVAKARKRLRTIATNVSADSLTIAAGRIFLGTRAAPAQFTKEFSYALNAPELTIGGPSIGFSGSTYPLLIDAELVVPLAASGVQEWSNVDNLVAALRAAWLTAGSYPAGEAAAHTCDFETYRAEARGDFTLVRVPLVVAFDNPDI
jgi:hypothetical protein